MKRRAFTVIELLVVIAIIATLAAILFPVFARAKEAARKTACLSNIKQIDLAWLLYAEDDDEMACPSYYYPNFGSGEVAWDFDMSQTPPKPGLLGPYTKTGALNACPSFQGQAWGRPYTGYGYNTPYLGGEYMDGTPPNPLSAISQPSKTAAFADSGYGNPVAADNYLRSPSQQLFMAGKVYFLHNGAANVSYTDGHAKATNAKHCYDPTQPDVGALSEDDSAYDLN